MASSQIEASNPVEASTVQAFSPGYTPENTRIHSLDVFKGIAIIAGLFITILYWGGFSSGMQNALTAFPGGLRYRAFAILSLLLEGKMMGLISLAFGAGIILFFVRPHLGSGLSNNDLYVRRNMWLMLFGLINAFVFMWQGDILFHLGIMGLLLFPFPRMNAKWILVSALLVLAISTGKHYWNYHDDTQAYSKFVVADSLAKKYAVKDSIQKRSDSIANAKLPQAKKDSLSKALALAKKDSSAKKSADTLTWKQKQEKEAWEGMAKKYKWERKNDSGTIKALQNVSYQKNWDHQVGGTQFREAAWFYRSGVWEFASLMLLGMWLFKRGFFNGRFSSQHYFLTGMISVVLGLFCGWYRLHFLNEAIADYTKYVQQRALPSTILRPLEIASVVIGYASLIMFVIQKGMLKGLFTLLSDIGKMALSNYLLQSLVLSVFFYGYGMGYYARIGQPGLYLIVIEMFIIHIVFTTFWLKFFYIGPAEWLLKSLIHKKRVPLKRVTEVETQREIPLKAPINY